VDQFSFARGFVYLFNPKSLSLFLKKISRMGEVPVTSKKKKKKKKEEKERKKKEKKKIG